MDGVTSQIMEGTTLMLWQVPPTNTKATSSNDLPSDTGIDLVKACYFFKTSVCYNSRHLLAVIMYLLIKNKPMCSAVASLTQVTCSGPINPTDNDDNETSGSRHATVISPTLKPSRVFLFGLEMPLHRFLLLCPLPNQ
jgi:hypothetical protein